MQKKQKSERTSRRPATSPRRRRLGQHFLSAGSYTARILEDFAAGPDDQVLEVGPGPGTLTLPLAGEVAALVAVELDARLAANLIRLLPAGGAKVVQGDILDLDWDLLLAAHGPGQRWRLLGNLPYSIATPLMVRAMQRGDLFTDLTVMVQREVAGRLLAAPGAEHYGPLAVLTALLCRDFAHLLSVPPGAFSPPPQVHSSVVRLDLLPGPPQPAAAAGAALARRAFLQRRKKLINALPGCPPAQVAAALEELGLAQKVRPEELSPAAFVALADILSPGAVA